MIDKQQSVDEEILSYPAEWVGGRKQTEQRVSPAFKRWVAWVGGNTAVYAAAFASVDWISTFSFSDNLFSLLAGLSTGLIVGLGQWLLLRKRLLRPGAWFTSAAIGMMLMFALYAVDVIPPMGLFFGMLVASILQVRSNPEILRHHRGLWVLLNPLAWSLSMMAAFTFESADSLMWIIPGLLYGLASSVGLKFKTKADV